MKAAAFRALVLCLVICFYGAPTMADPMRPILSDSSVSFGRHLPDARDAAFYRSWVTPERDKPHVLGAGQWTLETDRKTRLAYPRLVSLDNGASVGRANAALEAMHGRILKTAYQANSALTRTPFGELDTGLEFTVRLGTVKATYLSASTFSLIAIGDEVHDGNGAYVLVRGAAVDIAEGKIFTIRSCREDQARPFFTFGPLLTVCDERSLEAFGALWREQSRIARDQVPVVSRLPNTLTQEECRALTSVHLDERSQFSLYLTPAGWRSTMRSRLAPGRAPASSLRTARSFP